MANKKKILGLRLRKIEVRDWKEIIEVFQSEPPRGYLSGKSPEHEIEDSQVIIKIINDFSAREGTDVVYSLDGNPQIIKDFVKEGVFLLLKGSYINSLAMKSFRDGFGCPSLFLFYQANYISCKGILTLLGIQVLSKKGSKKNWILDIFSSIKNSPSKLTVKHRLIDLSGQGINHKEFWALFQRAISKTVFSKELKPLITLLSEIEPSSFAFQRNDVLYKSSFWPFDETLKQDKVNDFYLSLSKQKSNYEEMGKDSLDFLVKLSEIISKVSDELLKSLKDSLNVFEDDYELLQQFNRQYAFDREVDTSRS